MNIHKPQSNDAETLSKIAYASKRYWKYPEHWIDLWKEALTITPEFINENEVYAMYEKSRIIGFYALSVTGRKAKLEHLWIDPEFIGYGIGSKLFSHSARQARRLKAEFMDIDSDPNAEPFYIKMGALRIGEITNQIEGVERQLPRMRFDLKAILE